MAAPAPTTAQGATPKANSSRRMSATLAVAAGLSGIPYRWGGTTTSGFDCSGFTQHVFRKVGVKLPHSATAQMHKARKISRSKAKPGDLVFFRSGSRAYHVGIYAGNGRVLHSPRPGQRVKTVKIWTRNVTFGRVL